MAYAEVADVQAVLVRDFTVPAGTAGEMGPEQVQVALDAAHAEVDAKLTSRYTVPFAEGSVPVLVKALTVDVAAYLATLTYRQHKDLTAEDPVVLRYQRAQRLLHDLASGVIDLPGTDPTLASSGTATVRNPYFGKLFGLDDLGLGYGRTVTSRFPRRLGP